MRSTRRIRPATPSNGPPTTVSSPERPRWRASATMTSSSGRRSGSCRWRRTATGWRWAGGWTPTSATSGCWGRPWQPVARLDDIAVPREGAPVALKPGGILGVTLYWRPTAPLDADYTVFVHVIDAQGNPIAQRDTPPQGGCTRPQPGGRARSWSIRPTCRCQTSWRRGRTGSSSASTGRMTAGASQRDRPNPAGPTASRSAACG